MRKIVEYRRYDPIPEAPVSMLVAVDETGDVFNAATGEPWSPGAGKWKLTTIMSAEEWDKQRFPVILPTLYA